MIPIDLYNLKLKKFIGGRIVLTMFEIPIIMGRKRSIKSEDLESTVFLDDDERREKSIKSSLSRTKQKVHDIAFSNEWDIFVTITFDKQKVDRYNFDEISKKLSQKIKNVKSRNCPSLEYIVVPELHKDGAFHFHGLFRGIEGLKMVEARYPSGQLKKDSGGRQVYNLPQFNLGFAECSHVVDTKKSASYLIKYITKDLCAELQGRKKYWGSVGVDKTEVELVNLTGRMKWALLNHLRTKEKIVSAKTIPIDDPNYPQSIEYIILDESDINLYDVFSSIIAEAV